MKGILRRTNWPTVVGLLLLACIAVLLLVPSVFPVRPPDQVQVGIEAGGTVHRPPFAPGTLGYPLGSDLAGRDMLSRLAVGGRYTLGISLLVVALRAAVAVPLGLFAGWNRNWLAAALMTLSTAVSSIPSLVLIVFLLGTLSQVVRISWRLPLYCAVIAAIGVPRLAHQVAELTAAVRSQPFVEGAIAVGATSGRIVKRHVLPVLRGDIAVALATEVAWVMVIMGQLAVFDVFIGDTTLVIVGNRPVTVEVIPEWSQMMGLNRHEVRLHPWIPGFPAILLGLTVTAVHFLAEGLRRTWSRRRAG